MFSGLARRRRAKFLSNKGPPESYVNWDIRGVPVIDMGYANGAESEGEEMNRGAKLPLRPASLSGAACLGFTSVQL